MDCSTTQLVLADLLLEFCVSIPRLSGEENADVQTSHGADVDCSIVGHPVRNLLVHRVRDLAANLQHISTGWVPPLDRLAPDWRQFTRVFMANNK